MKHNARSIARRTARRKERQVEQWQRIQETRRELVARLAPVYQTASRARKQLLLDEVITKGIVNLPVGTQCIAELQRRKIPQDSERLGKIDRYATFLTSVTSFHRWNRSCKRVRYSPACKRCLRGWKCPAMGPKAERKRWACLVDLKRHIFFSRSRVGWCEFSARLFNPLCCRCSTPGRIARLAAP